MKIFLLDNYDSFTYNLADYLKQLGIKVVVRRNDEVTCDWIASQGFKSIVLSPGPQKPKDAGILMEVVNRFHQNTPLLGICLGHQALGEYFGAKLVKAELPVHGKTSLVTHEGIGLFKGICSPMQVMRYHSLVLENMDKTKLQITAQTSTKQVMAFEHTNLPLWGVQFHPESLLTPEGLGLLRNWRDMALSAS